jgi:hypothetical protein
MTTDESSNPEPPAQAEPPHAGKTTQESMRQAAHQPVTGPSDTQDLAASGGLEMPASGGFVAPEEHVQETDASALIPGARELDNLTHREPGAVSGRFNGSDIPAGGPSSLDAADTVEAYREGGLDRKTAERKAREHDGETH